MNHNSKAYELIKSNIKKTLKDYEKIIQVNEEDANYYEMQSIENKMKKIQEKLAKSQDIKKSIKKDETKNKKEKFNTQISFDLYQNDDFRNYNIYIPKIKLNESAQAKTTFSLNPMLDLQIEDSKLFDAKDNKLETSDFKFKKLEKIQKFKPDPLFFSNKYIEFIYSDISDRNSNLIKPNENLIYNALKKKIDENLTSSLYIANSHTPLFNEYSRLQKWEEKNLELENNRFIRLKEDEIIYDPKEDLECENEKKKKNEGLISINSLSSKATWGKTGGTSEINFEPKDKEKIYLDQGAKFKKWCLSKINGKLVSSGVTTNLSNNANSPSKKNILNTKINQPQRVHTNSSLNSKSQQPLTHSNGTVVLPSGLKIISLQSNDYNTDEKHIEEKYEAVAISFGIYIQGVIDKRIRQTNKFHTRGLLVEGPLATWFQFKNDENTRKVKGMFDLRKKENKMNIDEKEADKIIIKKFHMYGKEVDREVEFKTEGFKEFSGKSFKEVFTQIRTYYHYINTLKNKVDYTKLKYFSDPGLIQYVQSPLDSKYGLIENLDWHLKLKHLYLRGMDKTSVKNLFSILSISEIKLQSLTLESGVNSANLSNISQYEFEPINYIKNFFSNKTCELLQDFHLINFKFENGIKPLLDCLSLKFYYLKKKSVASYNRIEIPYKNLTIKRKEQALTCILDLNELYSFFNNMSNFFNGIDKFRNPFEKLDISGCDTINIDGLKNIINNFKIIKEIDLSNTKYVVEKLNQNNSSSMRNDKNNSLNFVQTSSFLINNLDFLKGIGIKHSFFNESLSKDEIGIGAGMQAHSSNNINININQLISTNTFKTYNSSMNSFKFGNNNSLGSGFDYTYGLLPILESIYVYETPINSETFLELISLFKVIKYLNNNLFEINFLLKLTVFIEIEIF
jgi:hypothetical protein